MRMIQGGRKNQPLRERTKRNQKTQKGMKSKKKKKKKIEFLNEL